MSDLLAIENIEKFYRIKLKQVCRDAIDENLPRFCYKCDDQQNVVFLKLTQSIISDINVLQHLPNLIRLDLSENQIDDISVLLHLPNLTQLDLRANSVSDIRVLSLLPNLTRLDLSSNLIDRELRVLQNLPNLTQLNLAGNFVSELSGLQHLPNLTQLNLAGNRVSDLRMLKYLPNLTQLDLSGNGRIKISVLQSLPNLTQLDLSDTSVENYSALQDLPNLTQLNLANNQLGSFKVLHCLKHLPNLTHLGLSYNKLSDLGALKHLPNLPNLTQLDFGDNHLGDLSELKHILNLTRLGLRNNLLSNLNKLPHLPNLTHLDLEENQLGDLTVLQYLPNLIQLNLAGNHVRELSVLQHLPNLTQLNLAGNRVSDLSMLQHLPNLFLVNLDKNQITEIPEWVMKLNIPFIGKNDYATFGISLKDNPIIEPPFEIAKKGYEAIRSYFEQIKLGKDLIYEAKLILVGEGGAGKTSLANKIIRPEYRLLPESESKSTQGIDIFRYEFPFQDKQFRVNIWDFGGQEIYHQTHQFFLSKRSLYFLVADNRKEDTDFYYWLNVVEMLSDNSPLLIINNNKHKRSRQIPDQLRAEFGNILAIEAVDLMDNQGLPELCKSLQHFITRLPHIGSPLPKTWIQVRKHLEQDPRYYISLNSYYRLCEQNGFKSESDKLQLSGFLHDLGICLHFQEDGLLRKNIFLKPTWATDAVYKVLDNSKVLDNFGRFNKRDLADIWQEAQYAGMRDELLALMLNFKLCYQIPNSKNDYIAPQLLENKMPNYAWDDQHNMLLRYRYEFMPKGILSQLIVSLHQLIANDYKEVWKTGVMLDKDNSQAEVIEYYGRREIHVRVKGSRKKDLLNLVCYELDKIHESYARIKVSKLIPCFCATCRNAAEPHFFDYGELKERIAHRKHEIECRKPPYLLVDVLKLIEDIEVNRTSHQTPDNVIYNVHYGDIFEGDTRMGDKYNVHEVKNTNSNFNVGHGNKQTKESAALEPKAPENPFKSLWFYLGLAVLIYALVVAYMAWDLQKKGMAGNKTFKEIVLYPLGLVSDYIKTDKK